MFLRLISILAFLCLALTAGAQAQSGLRIAYDAPVTICPAQAGRTAPDFTHGDCKTAALHDVDPQGRELWVRATVNADPAAFSDEHPLGLFVSVKAASEAWLNGQRLGANGTPAADRRHETPGRMDAVFYAPRSALKTGDNEIVLHLSGYHSLMRLNYPLHVLALREYADPTRVIMRAYWPSMMTIGVFLIGAVYFGVAAFRGQARGQNLLLLLLSLLAMAQLVFETARGLFAYAYPFHDLRLLAIAATAAAFGLCLLFHTAGRFQHKRRALMLAGGALATLIALALPIGFDGKSLFALMVPAAASAAIAIAAALRKQPSAKAYAIALSLFVAANGLFSSAFLDAGFFYLVAALIIFLMAQQAVLYTREQRLRQEAGDRARRLEIALEQARQKETPERLKIQRAGKTDFISANDIVYCKGAGDYVEITLSDGACITHLAKLQDMERDLPETFLRIHRSYLVNTDHVRALTRAPSGVGTLLLDNGETVPVSRRILPSVRTALA